MTSTKPAMTESRLAYLAARAIVRGFDRFERRFAVITDRAATRFEQRDPAGMQRDSASEIQQRIQAGEIIEIFPYDDDHRLHPASNSDTGREVT